MAKKIDVLAREVRIAVVLDQDYICLTDIARYKNPDASDDLIRNWLRNRNTIEFLGIWEQINNPVFKSVEFDGFRKHAGLNSFTLTPKQWIERTGAVGIQSKTGRYGGTYAHTDIAFEFAAWISVEFKLYLIPKASRTSGKESRRPFGRDPTPCRHLLPQARRAGGAEAGAAAPGVFGGAMTALTALTRLTGTRPALPGRPASTHPRPAPAHAGSMRSIRSQSPKGGRHV